MTRGPWKAEPGATTTAHPPLPRFAYLGDIPSILRLFDGTPEAAPAGMSDWDRAFLKSLYGSRGGSRLQHSQVALSMVREMVP